MSGLKVGDRVRYVGKSEKYADKAAIGRTGRVVSYVGGNAVDVDWDHTEAHVPASTVFRENVELVEPEFKKGDRVRVTRVTEGNVLAIGDTWLSVAKKDGFHLTVPKAGDGVTIEALDPEPLKPGTVGILGDYLLYVVDENDSKATNLHSGHQFHNPGVGGRNLARAKEFKVLHEPQAND